MQCILLTLGMKVFLLFNEMCFLGAMIFAGVGGGDGEQRI